LKMKKKKKIPKQNPSSIHNWNKYLLSVFLP